MELVLYLSRSLVSCLLFWTNYDIELWNNHLFDQQTSIISWVIFTYPLAKCSFLKYYTPAILLIRITTLTPWIMQTQLLIRDIGGRVQQHYVIFAFSSRIIWIIYLLLYAKIAFANKKLAFGSSSGVFWWIFFLSPRNTLIAFSFKMETYYNIILITTANCFCAPHDDKSEMFVY